MLSYSNWNFRNKFRELRGLAGWNQLIRDFNQHCSTSVLCHIIIWWCTISLDNESTCWVSTHVQLMCQTFTWLDGTQLIRDFDQYYLNIRMFTMMSYLHVIEFWTSRLDHVIPLSLPRHRQSNIDWLMIRSHKTIFHNDVIKWKHFPRYYMVPNLEQSRRRWSETQSRSLWRHSNTGLILSKFSYEDVTVESHGSATSPK